MFNCSFHSSCVWERVGFNQLSFGKSSKRYELWIRIITSCIDWSVENDDNSRDVEVFRRLKELISVFEIERGSHNPACTFRHLLVAAFVKLVDVISKAKGAFNCDV